MYHEIIRDLHCLLTLPCRPLDYILVYSIMFKRLLILESDKHSVWIKIVGIFLITLRFADWPYELAFHTLQQQIMSQSIESGSNCLAQW